MTLKCLIVEDSSFMIEIFRYSLADITNIDIVAEAHDGLEAIKLISEIKPDILILDLILPLKNGIEVLREISHLSPKTRTIVVSSLDDEATISRAKALGAIKYLTKPFTKTQLVNAIDEISKDYAEVNNG